jgi:hypothetical protein
MVAYELVLLYEVEACFDHDVVLVAQNRGDLVGDPFLHQVNVDLFNVDFLIELWWELSRLEALLIDAERHGEVRLGCSKVCGVLGGVGSVEVKVQMEVGGPELSEQLAARRQDEPSYVRTGWTLAHVKLRDSLSCEHDRIAYRLVFAFKTYFPTRTVGSYANHLIVQD